MLNLQGSFKIGDENFNPMTCDTLIDEIQVVIDENPLLI